MSSKGWSMAKMCVPAVALTLCLVVGVAPAAGVAGALYVDQNATRDCAGNDPCYPTIQAAVNNAQPGDTIYVFPGTYYEGVDLDQMSPQGDITLITVDASGNPTPGTVTVDNPGDDSEFYAGDPFLRFHGDVTIDGFVLRSQYAAIELWVGPAPPIPSDGDHAGLEALPTRDVEIRNVDASHTGGDGIGVSALGNVTITNCTTNDNEGYGIGVWNTYGDVTITGCTSNANKGLNPGLGGLPICQAGGICVTGVAGTVTISDSTANGNGSEGILVFSWVSQGQDAGPESIAPGQTIIDSCTANNNAGPGIYVEVGPEDVTITDCTTNGNGDDGVLIGGPRIVEEAGAQVFVEYGNAIIQNCTSKGNEESGFDVGGHVAVLSIQGCIAQDNQDGVDLSDVYGADLALLNGSIICGNECGVNLVRRLKLADAAPLNLEGNWWGCAGGPEAAGCDPICQLDSIAVDFTPWIDEISNSATVDPVNAGDPTVVGFQFSGNSSPVYLAQGPGDRRGPAPFTVSTDNGTLNGNGSTVTGFVGTNGTLEVTLVPDRPGTATVTVCGPCGLAGLAGATAVVGVGLGFVPEPGTLLLLGSGLLGLAGYAGLRLRKR